MLADAGGGASVERETLARLLGWGFSLRGRSRAASDRRASGWPHTGARERRQRGDLLCGRPLESARAAHRRRDQTLRRALPGLHLVVGVVGRRGRRWPLHDEGRSRTRGAMTAALAWLLVAPGSVSTHDVGEMHCECQLRNQGRARHFRDAERPRDPRRGVVVTAFTSMGCTKSGQSGRPSSDST